MSQAAQFRSGKGHRDENFPVASHLIHPRHRNAILAFYEFVRVADDIADHPSLSEGEKLSALDRLEQSLMGKNDTDPEGMALHRVLSARNLSSRHAQDLLTAFRLDVTKSRYANWDELIHYCSYSAMPVGRYVLDVHGETRAAWPASDAICAALQINNHLQDCGKDYRDLGRVYIPQDALAEAGARTEELGAERASPALLTCLHKVAHRTKGLLQEGAILPDQINDLRLSLEISVIHALALKIVRTLERRDPLHDRVHLKSFGFAAVGIFTVIKSLLHRPLRRAALAKPQDA